MECMRRQVIHSYSVDPLLFHGNQKIIATRRPRTFIFITRVMRQLHMFFVCNVIHAELHNTLNFFGVCKFVGTCTITWACTIATIGDWFYCFTLQMIAIYLWVSG